MSTQLVDLLAQWYPLRDSTEWVLGTVYDTEGPAYRKAGAMMMLGGHGQQLGMLSGGCLESDIGRHARKVMGSNSPIKLTYDGTDEDDISYQLGIGCGGRVHIVLQPVNQANDYLKLDFVLKALSERRSCQYSQLITDSRGEHVSARFSELEAASQDEIPRLISEEGLLWLHTTLTPPPHLLIAGGGIDARPVAAIAHQLGWQTTVWDPRPANGRPEYFPTANRLLSCEAGELAKYVQQERVDAAILMTHSVRLDAEALRSLLGCSLKYWALLGPESRRQHVLSEAKTSSGELPLPLAGPAGLDLGSGMPETIALSILSECQAAMNKRSASSLSNILN